MCAFGESEQLGAERITTNEAKKLVERSSEQAKQDLSAISQAASRNIQPPADVAVRAPDFSRMSPEQVGFFKTPMNINSLIDTIKTHTAITAQGITVNIERAREAFDERFKNVFSKDQADAIFRWVAGTYLTRLSDSGADLVNTSQKAGNAQGRDAGLSAGQAATTSLSKIGVGTLVENQKEFLKKASDGLNEAQLRDMLTAAIQVGFDLRVVSSFMKEDKKPGSLSLPATERDIMNQQFIQAALNTADRFNREMQLAKRELDRNETADNRERYELARSRLKNFLGSEATVAELEKLGSIETDVVTKAIMGQVGASYNLHTGRPDQVVPQPRQRAA